MSEKSGSNLSKTIWLTLVICGALFGAYYLLHWPPGASSKYSRFIDDRTGDIAYDGDDQNEPPLTHISSGFKCVRILGEPKFTSIADLLSKTEYRCEWGWQYEVKNNLDVPVRIEVEYQLEDRDEFVLARSVGSIDVAPGKTETIIEVSNEPILVSDLERVYRAGWLIGYRALTN